MPVFVWGDVAQWAMLGYAVCAVGRGVTVTNSHADIRRERDAGSPPTFTLLFLQVPEVFVYDQWYLEA